MDGAGNVAGGEILRRAQVDDERRAVSRSSARSRSAGVVSR